MKPTRHPQKTALAAPDVTKTQPDSPKSLVRGHIHRHHQDFQDHCGHDDDDDDDDDDDENDEDAFDVFDDVDDVDPFHDVDC